MKPNLIVFTAICTAILMLTPVASATDVPGMPEVFRGTVTVNGESAPDGTIVSAWIGSVEKASQTTKDGKYGYDTIFQVDGSGTITFKIYDTVAGTDTLDAGDATELDLSATGVVIPTSTPAPKTSDPSETSETSNPSGGGGFASPDATPKPSPTVAMTKGDVQLAQPASASPHEESGEAAKEPETIPTADQGGEKPSSSIPGFAGVTAVFMLLVIFRRKRNG